MSQMHRSEKGQCHSSWWNSQSLPHVFISVSIHSYPWNQVPEWRKEPCSFGAGRCWLSTPAVSSPVFPGGASTSPQPSVRYLIHIWPYHQYLGFPLDGFRKLSAQGDDALNVSSTLSGAESSQVGIILLSNICCIFTGPVHRTKIVLILWDRFLDFYHFVSTPKRL